MLSKLECERAPCGCPATPIPTRTATRYPQYNPTNCPSSQRGSFQQYGTDLQIPLIEQHVRYCEEYQSAAADGSYQSTSTQMDAIHTEEGYSRYNSDGLNVVFPMRLTPEDGINRNERHQMERAIIRGRARRISESLARYVQGEQQDYAEIDGNGFYASPSRVRMAPAYFSSPAGPMTGTMSAQHGNPSSRGQSSSHRSSRRRSHHSSSRHGNSDDLKAAGGQFAEIVDERATEMSVSDYVEDGVFQYEP